MDYLDMPVHLSFEARDRVREFIGPENFTKLSDDQRGAILHVIRLVSTGSLLSNDLILHAFDLFGAEPLGRLK
jgi:hypothetical protein